MWQSQSVVEALAFVFGLVVGSFLNVCIWRLPQGKSIVRPRSHCPRCQTPLGWRDNLPLLSFALLRGRCRSCRQPVSWMYPVVEALTGSAFWGCYRLYGWSWDALKWVTFSCVLIVLMFTDLRERILPDKVNFFGLVAGLLLSLRAAPDSSLGLRLWTAVPQPLASWSVPLLDALAGALVGGGILWLFAEGYFRLRGREGMGLGDVKMMFMAGAFLGVRPTLLMLLLASLLGTVVGIVVVWGLGKGREYELPFGTFLGIAGLLIVFVWEPLLSTATFRASALP